MKYDALIFDLDGTLVDNISIIAYAWKQIVKKHNWESFIDKNVIKSIMGLNPKEIGRILFPNDFEDVSTSKAIICIQEELDYLDSQMGHSYIDETTLKRLTDKTKLFIVSNCLDGYIEKYLKYYHFEKYFVETVNSSNNNSKSDNIKYLMQKYKLKNPMYIGDTIKDYEAAKQANIKFVYAAYGFGLLDYSEKINNIDELFTKFIDK